MSSGWRKAYYGSLGVQVVDVTPSVESALGEDVLDLDKLQKLCYWVRIPHHYRTRVWNVLLGVRPTIRELWDFADEQHEVLFGELREAAAAVYGADPTTIPDTPSMVLSMVRTALLHRSCLPPHPRRLPDPMHPSLKHLHHIAKSMYMICDRHARLSYWLFVSFLRQKGGFAEVIFSTDRNEQLKAVARDALMTERILKEQGGESGRSVSARLKQLGVNLDGLLASSLMASFSDVFPPHCLERIWDIILGGSRDILAYISAAFLISLRRRLDELETADDVFREMESGELVKGIDTDAVTQTGIGIWERNQAQYSVFRSGGSNVSPSGAGGAGAGGAR